MAARSADAIAHALRRGAEIGARGRGGARRVGGRAGPATPARERALRQVRDSLLPAAGRAAATDDPRPADRADGRAAGSMLCARSRRPGRYLGRAGAASRGRGLPGHLPPVRRRPRPDRRGRRGGHARRAGRGAAGSRPASKLVHANDSLTRLRLQARPARGDRRGTIGAEPFRALFAQPAARRAVRGRDAGGKAGHARDIATLKGLRCAVCAGQR